MLASRPLRILLSLVVLLVAASALVAQTPVLLKDIYASTSSGRPGVPVVLNGIAYFTAEDATGKELWRSDGTTAGTTQILDINPGFFSSNPDFLTAAGNKLYFWADDGVHGKEPWVTDGTPAGTFLLMDIRPGSSSSMPGANPPPVIGFNGKAYFIADDGVRGQELYISDGTIAGTQLMIEFNPAGPGCFSMAVANNTIWLNAVKDNLGGELWKSDGTVAGTVFVKDIMTPPGVGSSPYNYMAHNGIVYFTAQAANKGSELFRTDGTAAGTYMLKEIATDNSTAFVSSASVQNLTSAGPYLYFSADDHLPGSGRNVWRSDGTEAGTVKLGLPSTQSSGAGSFVNLNGSLLLLYLYNSNLGDIWRIDADGTMTKIWTGSGGTSFPRGFTVADGLAFFTAGELMRTDGTAAGSGLYADFWNNGSSGAFALGELGNRLMVAAFHSTYGSEPWMIALCGNSFPKPVIVPAEAEACPGGVGHASVAASYASYVWSITNGTITAGQGTPSVTYTAASSGASVQLSVSVSSAAGCSGSASATVPMAQAPVISASGPTTFCTGGSVTLSAPAGYTYLWSTGETTQSIIVNATGSYTVAVTNGYGCSVTSAPRAVTVNTAPATPAVSASGPTTFCAGGSVTLSAPAGYTYLWSTGAATQSISVSTTGDYSVTVTNANGCSATSTATSVAVNAAPATPAVTASGPTTFCEGGSVTLSAPSGYSYLWSNGATTQSINVSASGSYSVTVTDGNGCTATSDATTVTVNAVPPATITAGGPTTFCEGGSVTLSAPAGYSYLWSNGATSESITVSNAGSYSVTVTNANGCAATSAATTVTVNPAPAFGVRADAVYGYESRGPVAQTAAASTYTFCGASNMSIRLAPTVLDSGWTYLWSTGATTFSTIVNAAGTYTLTVTAPNGCSRTESVTVVINTPPTVSISGARAICPGGTTTLTASAAASYAWSNGATTQSIVVDTPGSYSVTVTGENGCTAGATASVVLNEASITAEGPTTFCHGGSVTLTAGEGGSYLWSNGATTRSITVTESGTYSVTQSFAEGCALTPDPVVVTVGPADVTIAIDDNSVCPNAPMQFTSSVTGGNANLTYQWTLNDVPLSGATGASLTHSTTQSGYSTMRLVVTDPDTGCTLTSNALTFYVWNQPAPTISANGPTTFCEGNAVMLTASAATSYLWSNGENTQSIWVTQSGSYSVTVTESSGCSGTSAPVNVTVNARPAKPAINASGPLTFCQGGSVTLTAPSGFTYLWSTGATSSSIVVSQAGTYDVTVTNASGCSMLSDPVTVNVNALPPATVTASGPTTFCQGGSVTLSAPAGLSYAWSNGATTQSINVTQSGNYSVTVTNANGCSATSATTAVTVNANPSATVTASGPTTFCEGGLVTLSAPAGLSYLWSNGATSQSINVTQSGNYSVTTTNASGCSTTSSATAVTVNPNPAATVTPSGPTTFCAGGSVTLSAPAGLSYLWSTGATTQSINVTQSGNYSVTTTNASGCSTTSSATTVTVNANPSATVTASGPTTFCAGGSVTLSAPAGLSYLWSNGATSQSINVTQSGNYSVTTTNASGCSTTSAATAVTVNPNPTATITPSGPTTFCAGGSVTLSAPAGLSYLWSTGATSQSINVTQSGNYSVTTTNASGCSTTSAATTVTVNANPAATITPSGPTTFCAGGSVTLSAPAGLSYVWSTGATTQSINVTQSGNYSVTTTNAGGCSTTSAPTAVTVNPNPTATVTASGPLTFCEGGSVTLSAPAGLSYVWSNGATTQSINATQSGNYSVTVTNASGCSATSSATTVTVNPLPAVPVITGPSSFCPSTSITLTAPAGYASYLWSNGQTTPSISVSAAGDYTVTVTNAQGCSRMSAPFNVTANAPTQITTQPANATISRNVSHQLSVTATGTAPLQYQWYLGNSGDTSQPVAGATSSTYTAGPFTKKGTYRYWVRVTSATCTGSVANSNTATITVAN